MANSLLPVSGPHLVPENQNPKQLALGRCLTEDCEILDWRFQSLEPLPQNGHCDRNSPCDWKGGAHHGR